MNRFERSIEIASPADVVFDLVSDLTRHGEWATNPLTIEISTPGPIAVGTEFRSRAVMAGKKGEDKGRVTALESPTRFAFVTEGAAGIVENWFAVTPLGPSRCVLTKGSNNTKASIFSVLMVPVLRIMVPRWYDRNLRAIGALVVAQARSGG